MLRRATISATIIPVICGSAFKNKGVQQLLDSVVEFLPSPKDIGEIMGHHPHLSDHVIRQIDDSEKFSALAFKIMTDPFVGRLTFTRIYSGTIKAGSYAYNSTTNRRERIGRVLRMHANHREDVDEAYTGDIIAIVGLKNTRTGDTLCDENDPVILEQMKFRNPSFPSPSSRKPKPIRNGSAKRWQNFRKRIRRSACIPTMKPGQRLSPAWANCTLKSSWTGYDANSVSKQTSASRKSRIVKRSGQPWKWRANSSVSRAVTGSTGTCG